MTNKIRIAIVGTGYFSQFHFDAWKRLDVNVVAICSLNENEAIYYSKIFNNCEHRIPTEGSSFGLEFIKKNLYS